MPFETGICLSSHVYYAAESNDSPSQGGAEGLLAETSRISAAAGGGVVSLVYMAIKITSFWIESQNVPG